MSKVSDNSLNELLLSLNGSEKRFVHLYLRNRQGGDNHFLRLFKLYSSSSITDTEVLAKVNIPSLKKHLKVNKHYLYNHVLRALRILNDESNPEQIVNNLLQEIRILSEKKLLTQCKSRLKKAKAIAEKYFLFSQQSDLAEWSLRIANLETDLEYLKSEIAPVYKKVASLMADKKELMEYQRLSYENFLLLKTKWVRKGNVLPEFIATLSEKNPAQLKSPQAKILHSQILSTSYFADAQPDKAMEELIRLRKVFVDFPEMQENYFVQYLACLNNLNLLFFDKGLLKEMRENTDVLKHLKPDTDEKRMRVKERWLSAEISLMKRTGKEESEIRNELKKLVSNVKLSPVYRLLFLHDLAGWEFFSGNRKSSLVFLNKVLNETDRKLRPDIQRTARIFNFIFHYESGKTDYVKTMLRKPERFRWDKENEDEFEKWFFVWMRKLCFADTRTEKKKLFLIARDYFNKAWKNEYISEHYLNAFDFERWIKTKI